MEGSSWQFNDVLSIFDDINVEADLDAEFQISRIHCQQSTRNIINMQLKTIVLSKRHCKKRHRKKRHCKKKTS